MQITRRRSTEFNYRWILDLTSDIISQIEDLRFSNSTLRDWGHEVNDELEEAETDNERLQQRIEKLEDDIDYLKSELKEMA